MNLCIEYKMHLIGQNMLSAPSWMLRGGFYFNPVDKTYIGFIPPEDERDYWVPDGLQTLTEDDLVNRCLEIHKTNPYTKVDESDPANPTKFVDLTIGEVKESVSNFYHSNI